jgi:ArsR family transcriptional regulator, arsenate/arsenite/antimonite-responsive transcriptional repressor / arsenate reductase (thioredoxin)
MYPRTVGSPISAVPAFARLAGHPLRWRLLTELTRSDLRVRELVALVDQPQNLVSYHLRLLRQEGLVATTRSTFDGRDTYYHLDLDRCAEALTIAGAALHPALRLIPQPPTVEPAGPVSVLFVCTGNSARSPIAEALARHHSGGLITAASAGIHPKEQLHPHAVRVLRERNGIDIARQRPRPIASLDGRRFDYLISLCDKAREAIPALPGQPRRLHWSVPDPTDYPTFVRMATDIDARMRYLLPLVSAPSPKED